MVVCLVEALVVIPIEVGAGLHQHVRLENEVALFRLYGETLASGQGHHAVVSVEVYWFVVDFSDALVVALCSSGATEAVAFSSGTFPFNSATFAAWILTALADINANRAKLFLFIVFSVLL